MVHYQRYYQCKKGQVDKESQHTIIVMDYGGGVSGCYKRTRTRLFSLLFLSLLCCCFILAPQLFTIKGSLSFPYLFVGESEELLSDTDVNLPLCSSISNGTICCDRSSIRSDICYMKGDVRTHSPSSSIFLYTSQNPNFEELDDEHEVLQHETIKPYTRKWEQSVMNTIDELSLTSKRKKLENGDHCDVHHDVPAVFFSTGGYTGNVYHEFNDGLLPLYITSQHLNRKVVFVMLEYHDWWISKYENILSLLSDYPPIDFTGDKRTHCFPEAIVGLKIHDELTVDSNLMHGNKSIRDFRNILNEAYLPRINGLIQEEEQEALLKLKESVSLLPLEARNQEMIRIAKRVKNQETKPKLVIVSRKGSRMITNEDLLVKMAEELGFRVRILRPHQTSEMAKIYRVLNSSDVMIGVHGAAMTHFMFMRPGSVFIQVVPLGTDWAAETYYGEPAMKLGLRYIGYKILPRESSLSEKYDKNDVVLKDPTLVNDKGWEFTKKIYLDGQNVRLDLGRFRKRLSRAYDYSVSKTISKRSRRRFHRRSQ